MARLGEPLPAPNPSIRKNRPVYAASRISRLRKSSRPSWAPLRIAVGVHRGMSSRYGAQVGAIISSDTTLMTSPSARLTRNPVAAMR